MINPLLTFLCKLAILHAFISIFLAHNHPYPRDSRKAIREGYFGKFEISPGQNLFSKIPAGNYFVFPAVKFNGSDIFPGSFWFPGLFDKEFTVEYKGKEITVKPILWGPKEIDFSTC